MPPADLVVTGTRVVMPGGAGPAAVAVTAGTITAVTAPEAAPDARQRFDAGDAAVLPGLVDTRGGARRAQQWEVQVLTD